MTFHTHSRVGLPFKVAAGVAGSLREHLCELPDIADIDIWPKQTGGGYLGMIAWPAKDDAATIGRIQRVFSRLDGSPKSGFRTIGDNKPVCVANPTP